MTGTENWQLLLSTLELTSRPQNSGLELGAILELILSIVNSSHHSGCIGDRKENNYTDNSVRVYTPLYPLGSPRQL